MGFNGGQILALAIGGCFCNSLYYEADEMGTKIASVSISVTLDLDGDPLIAVSASVTVACAMLDGSDPEIVIERARSTSTVSNSLALGFPVSIKKTA